MPRRQKKKVIQKETSNKLNKRRIIEKLLSNSRNNYAAFNLDLLVDGWLELESDPGTFSLLIEDFGCFGAQVEEVYDLEQKFDGPVFGFIFLFKWLNNQPSDRTRNQNLPTNPTNDKKGQSNLSHHNNINSNTNNSCISGGGGSGIADSNNSNSNNINNNSSIINDKSDNIIDDHRDWSYVEDENIVSEIFFAKQMISNSCATHALISILLNCDHDGLNLGPTLTRLKEHTKVMNPENKGYAIGNVPELAKAHNSHASFSSLYGRNKPSSQARGMSFMMRGSQRTNLQQQKLHETYHFVSYMPINNRLYELDGLKNYPIDHGRLDPKEDWTEKFRRVIKQRLLDNTSGDDQTLSNDIRYNLMAVVPDKRINLGMQLKKLKFHLESVHSSIKQMKKQILASTMATDTHDLMYPPFSPISNGTLTASEAGSVCNSPKHNYHHDDQYLHPNEAEIPRPPYSPLSNDTLTASEAGSPHNSPRNLDDSFFYDEPNKVEKIFFIKFDKQVEPVINNNNELILPSGTTTSTSTMPLANVRDKNYYALYDMKQLSSQIKRDIERLEVSLREEIEKRRKYKIDNSRRTHNYEPFIMTFLSMLAKQGNLADLIEKDLGLVPEDSEATTTTTTTTTTNTTNLPHQQSPLSSTSSTTATTSTITAKTKTATTKLATDTPKAEPKKRGRKPLNRTEPKPKPKYKYVSTGRPRGRPRKNPL